VDRGRPREGAVIGPGVGYLMVPWQICRVRSPSLLSGLVNTHIISLLQLGNLVVHVVGVGAVRLDAVVVVIRLQAARC